MKEEGVKYGPNMCDVIFGRPLNVAKGPLCSLQVNDQTRLQEPKQLLHDVDQQTWTGF